MSVDREWRTMEGRWFTGAYDEIGMDVTLTKRLSAMGTGAKTRSVLYDNVYGWFRRTGTARYRLSAHGARDIGAFPELAARFRAEAEASVEPAAAARASSAHAPAASQRGRGGVSSRRRGRT